MALLFYTLSLKKLPAKLRAIREAFGLNQSELLKAFWIMAVCLNISR
jgi:hypothetical protein